MKNNNKVFKITITETLQREVLVFVDSTKESYNAEEAKQEALDKVIEEYEEEVIVLDSNDFTGSSKFEIESHLVIGEPTLIDPNNVVEEITELSATYTNGHILVYNADYKV